MIDQEKIHQQCCSDDKEERKYALVELENSFSSIPDKQHAWNDLHRLINDKDWFVRVRAAKVISSVFFHIPDKQQAWNDLHRLTNDENIQLRFSAAFALGRAFPHLPDKQQAWSDLIQLETEENVILKSITVFSLGSAFPYVPDKQKAYNSLHKLTIGQYRDVMSWAASTLGSAFSHVSDKQQVWNYLQKLAYYRDSKISSEANHSLGKISIFKASQAEKEEDYKKELENAIAFFEKAIEEDRFSAPSKFCLPFYRSFHAIIFKKQGAEEEIDKYLEEAKEQIWGSKSKELLFEAVENLANALTEVQKLENMDLEALKGELNSYRKYCDRVEEIINNIEENAPFAIETMRIGSRILDRNLKELIEEIQKKAKIACKESQGTSTQEVACTVNREVQKWEIGSQEEMSWYVPNIVLVLKSKIPHVPENKGILHMIESMIDEKDLCKQYRTLSAVIGLIPTVNVVLVEPVLEKIESLEGKFDAKFEEMIVSLKSGPRAELVISMGLKALGSGTQGVITIPLKEIDYPELPMDLEIIKGKFLKVSELPGKLFEKVQGYLH